MHPECCPKSKIQRFLNPWSAEFKPHKLKFSECRLVYRECIDQHFVVYNSPASQDGILPRKKASKEGTYMWKTILEWRNTPTPFQCNSPVQRLMPRTTRSFLPCKKSLFNPEVQSTVTARVVRKQKLTKRYHNNSHFPV